MRPVLSNTNRPPTSNRHTTSEAINILYATRYIIPLFTNVVELEFSELPLNGVLGSSLPASNHKQRQRYDVCGMCQNARSWYSASQQEERSEAPKYAPQKVGTHGV